MKKINLKKLFKKYHQPASIERNVFQVQTIERDWKIMVILFAVGLISLSIFAWQIYLSDKIGGGYLTSDLINTETGIKTVDKKRLQADLLLFDERADSYLKLKNSSIIVDPSL